MITQISVKHFKSIFNVQFEPGMVNVLIGANGSGKSALLDAIGVLSAAIGERVDDSSLQSRGVRLGTPALYKSSFKNQRVPLTIELGICWQNSAGHWDYKVNLNNPIEKPRSSWEFHSERLDLNKSNVFGRSRATKLENLDIEIDKYSSLFSFSKGIGTVKKVEDLFNTIKEYGIYTPNTSTLRGTQPDPFQRQPVGLLGGRLAEAANDLLQQENGMFGTMELDDLLELVDWVNSINVGKPSKYMLSPSVPSMSKVIIFTDRFMGSGRNELTSHDASEGSLFVLFVLIMALHEASPKMFAIDNFDQAMNPRLARKVTKIFCDQVIRNNKIAFITTHNPQTLDGLDLWDNRIRLFTVERNELGYTQINRVMVNEELSEMGKKGYSLSRLWTMGRLGGVPNL